MHPRPNYILRSVVLCLLISTLSGCSGSSVLPLFNGYFSDGVTTVESRDSSGNFLPVDQPTPAISADGRFVAFEVRYGAGSDIYFRDRATGITELVSVASDGTPFESLSWEPSLSADGRLVAFESFGEDLSSDALSDVLDIFVRDRQTGATVLVSNGINGATANGYSRSPAISQDGRFVAFPSGANNLVPSDTNGKHDVFLHDLQTQSTIRVNVSSVGDQDNGGAEDREPPAISGDGRFVAFESLGNNLVPDDTNGEEDVFVHDRVTLATVRVSVGSSGQQGDNTSRNPAMSADGRLVAFISYAKNLAPGNAFSEASSNVVYVHDRDADGNGVFDETCDGCRRTERVPLEAPDFPDDGGVSDLSMSGDGSTIAYCRTLTTTDDPRAPYTYDSTVWIYNRATGASRRVAADVPGVRIEGDSLYFVPISRQSVNDTERPQLSHDGRFVTYLGELGATFSGAPEAVFVENLRP